MKVMLLAITLFTASASAALAGVYDVPAARAPRADAIPAHGGECSDAIARDGRVLPCGCWAQHRLLGVYSRFVNGLNYYLAATWARFPRTSPHAGSAALFARGGHIYHVAPVEARVGDSVILNDSWGRHAVPIARIALFVEPR